MKKILFFLIFSFCFILNTYAVEIENHSSSFKNIEDSCSTNLLPPYLIKGTINNNQNYYASSNYNLVTYLVAVKPSTEYRLKFDFTFTSSGYYISFFNNLNSARIGGIGSRSKNYLFTTNSNTNYIAISFGKSDESVPNLFNNTMSITEGSDELPYEDYSSNCSPPTPPAPPEDTTYSSFITLYLDRITYLASGFTTNPYLIAMVGIIFSWVVLELFLRVLYLKGGYKK